MSNDLTTGWPCVSIRPTRFAELGYTCDGPRLWRFVDMSTLRRVGAHYKSQKELLADLFRYAKEFGCDVE